MRLTEAEWAVMEALWSADRLSLKEVTAILVSTKGWSKNTVHTYLTRMEAKSLVAIDRQHVKPYCAMISREDAARGERNQLLHKIYNGAAGDLIAAFLKEAPITHQEADRLRQLLDEMEV